MRVAKCAIGLTLLVALAFLAACARETELAFETIVQDDEHGAGEGPVVTEPYALIITTPDEILALRGLVSQKALDRVQEIDFQKHFVIALFRGRRATGGHSTIIQRVARREDTIVIDAEFWEPSPYYVVTNVATAPYHLIQVERYDGVSSQTELVIRSKAVTPTPPPYY